MGRQAAHMAANHMRLGTEVLVEISLFVAVDMVVLAEEAEVAVTAAEAEAATVGEAVPEVEQVLTMVELIKVTQPVLRLEMVK